MNRDNAQQGDLGDTGMQDEDMQREDLGETNQEDIFTDESY